MNFKKIFVVSCMFAVGVCFLHDLCLAASVSQNARSLRWTTGGLGEIIRCLYQTADTLYVGGTFNYLGPHTSSFMPVDTQTALPCADYPYVDGIVSDCIPDGHGGTFICGDFDRVGEFDRSCVAHILADDSVDPDWSASQLGGYRKINSLALVGDKLYIGGFFSSVGSASRNGLAVLDANTGQLLDWDPALYYSSTVSPYVWVMAVSGSTLFVSGQFKRAMGVDQFDLVAFDTQSGQLLDWNAQLNSIDSMVYDMVVHEDCLFVAGVFGQIGGQTALRLAVLDTVTAQPIVCNTQSIGGNIYTLDLRDQVLYVGGSFENVGSEERRSLAAFDSTTMNLLEWAPFVWGWIQTNEGYLWGDVTHLSVLDSTVYVGGRFNSICGQSRAMFGAVDAVSGELKSWQPGTFRAVSTLKPIGSRIYVGSEMQSIGGRIRQDLAAIDLDSGKIKDWDVATEYNVFDLCESNGVLYVGGDFGGIGVEERESICAVDASTGQVLDWNPVAPYVVHALETYESSVFAGGFFYSIGGKNCPFLAQLDRTTGLATDWNPGIDGDVKSMIICGQTLYIGGEFWSLNEEQMRRSGIASFDLVSGNPTPWAPQVSADNNYQGWISALASSGSMLYAGGYFTNVNSQTRLNVAQFDTVTGSLTQWNPGANGDVYALAAVGDDVLIGGEFTQAGGQAQAGLARIDAHTGAVLPLEHNTAEWAFTVWALSASQRAVFAGGEFLCQYDVLYQLDFQTDSTSGTLLQGPTAQEIAYGQDAQPVTAVAPPGYHFVNWTCDEQLVSTSNPLLIKTVVCDSVVQANFESDDTSCQLSSFYYE